MPCTLWSVGKRGRYIFKFTSETVLVKQFDTIQPFASGFVVYKLGLCVESSLMYLFIPCDINHIYGN